MHPSFLCINIYILIIITETLTNVVFQHNGGYKTMAFFAIWLTALHHCCDSTKSQWPTRVFRLCGAAARDGRHGRLPHSDWLRAQVEGGLSTTKGPTLPWHFIRKECPQTEEQSSTQCHSCFIYFKVLPSELSGGQSRTLYNFHP